MAKSSSAECNRHTEHNLETGFGAVGHQVREAHHEADHHRYKKSGGRREQKPIRIPNERQFAIPNGEPGLR
jgi:hypothetical protein